MRWQKGKLPHPAHLLNLAPAGSIGLPLPRETDLTIVSSSYKFLRSFPLSQYDLPMPDAKIMSVLTHRPAPPPAPHGVPSKIGSPASTATPPQRVSPSHNRAGDAQLSPRHPPLPAASTSFMSAEQVSDNPEVDYTRPELIANVVSDVGILTPSAVSQYLVQIFAD